METFKSIINFLVGIGGGIAAYLFGGLDSILIALILFIIADYISGVVASYFTKKTSSKIGFKGILKKFVILLIVGLGVILERDLGIPAVREVVIMFFISNEGISIIENATEIGIKIPNIITNALEQVSEKGEITNESNDKSANEW